MTVRSAARLFVSLSFQQRLVLYAKAARDSFRHTLRRKPATTAQKPLAVHMAAADPRNTGALEKVRS